MSVCSRVNNGCFCPEKEEGAVVTVTESIQLTKPKVCVLPNPLRKTFADLC